MVKIGNVADRSIDGSVVTCSDTSSDIIIIPSIW